MRKNWISRLLLAPALVLPLSAAAPTLNTIYSFTDLGDGAFPQAGVVLSPGGLVFGTTSGGSTGWGTVYELKPTKGGGYTEVTLYSFTGGTDGANPVSDLVFTSSGVLYGTTYGGGASGYGTVFEMTPGTGGTYTHKVLYSFKGGSDGAYPAAGMALQSSGALYGTTYGGGTAGLGTVFELTPSAGGFKEKVLYSFQGSSDGAYPNVDLTIGGTGVLYGTTSQGGSVTIPSGTPPCPTTNPPSTCTYTNWGTVFELSSAGGTWTETLLYTFLGANDGGTPESALIIGPGGVLFGSAFWGGSPTTCPVEGYPQGCGTIYQLAPPVGTGAWTQSVLHTFTGTPPDGTHPYRNMAYNSSSGILFGTTYSGGNQVNICFPDGALGGCGIIFNLKPPASPGGVWSKNNVEAFTGKNGGVPSGITLGPGGTLYGTTEYGGPSPGYGIVYEWKP